jgi:hypothetical protein
MTRELAPSQALPSGTRERWLYLCCIVLTPAVQLAMNPNLFITPGGPWIDSWVYTGCFLDFKAKFVMFANTYYLTRLAWILPGSAVHALLPALAANYVLHLGFFYALLFAIYALVSHGAGRPTAILITLVTAWSPIVLSALSWDYIDGAGIVFLAITWWCLERAAGGSRRAWAWSFAAGAGMACMVTTNLFLAVMAPITMLFFTVRVGLEQRWLILRTAGVAALGGAASLAAFSLVNVMFGGPWLFLAPSFAIARYVTSTPSIWKEYAWYNRALWLVLPATGTAGAILHFGSRRAWRSGFTAAVQVTLLVTVALWTAYELRGIPLLQFSHYSSYLAPFALVALPLQSGFRADGSAKSRIVLPLATLALLAAAHWLFLIRVPGLASTLMQLPGTAALVYNAAWFGPFGTESLTTFIAVAGGLGGVLCLRFLSGTSRRWFGFIVGLTFMCAAAPTNYPPARHNSARADYLEIGAIERYVSANTDGRALRFWYDYDRNPTRPFRAVASTFFWSYTLVNERLPMMTAKEAAALPAATRLVFLVPAAADVDRARETLRMHGLETALVDQRIFGEGKRSVFVVIADLMRLPDTRGGV